MLKNQFLREIAYALRALARRPGYTIVVVLVLGLGIGASTTVFSVFSGLYLQPLPYPEDERLVAVYNSYPRAGLEFAGTSIPDYLDRRELAPSLQELAMYNLTMRSLGHEGNPEQVLLGRVTPSLFRVLRIDPLLGRTFTPEEALPGNHGAIVLSHSLWTSRFGHDPQVVGKTVRLDGESYTVVGVMPPKFFFPRRNIRSWIPLTWAPELEADSERGNELAASIGLLAPDATLSALNAELASIVARNAQRLPDLRSRVETSGFTGVAESWRDFLVGDVKRTMLVLQLLVFAVLLIACANVANLQVARALSRRPELATRMALGAKRWRLIRILLTESTALALLGASAGLALAYAGVHLVRALGLDRSDQGFAVTLDWRVLSFTLAAAVVSAVLPGALPAAGLLREDLGRVIKNEGRTGASKSTKRVRNALVVFQVGVGVALLIGAGLLFRTFHELRASESGFEAHGVLTGRIVVPEARYSEPEAIGRLLSSILEVQRALPGVQVAAYTSTLPFSGNNWTGAFAIDGYTLPDGAPTPNAQHRSVSEDYLAALSIPVVRGRPFTAREAERVAIVDQTLANRYWPNGDALGQRIRHAVMDSGDEWSTIIGIVPPTKHSGLGEEPRETIYWHYLQRPMPVGAFALKAGVPPEHLSQAAADAVALVDPELALFDLMPLESRIAESLGAQRSPMALMAIFALIASALAVVGIYAVLVWTIGQRSRELAMHMALGARAGQVEAMVVRQGVELIALGIAVGVAAALGLTRVASSHLEGLGQVDPKVMAAAVVALGLAGLFASWVPARRAARIEPVHVLRAEQ